MSRFPCNQILEVFSRGQATWRSPDDIFGKTRQSRSRQWIP